MVEQHLRNHMAHSWSGHHMHRCFGTRQQPCCPPTGSSVVVEEQQGFEHGALHMWIHMRLLLDHRTHFGLGNCMDQNIVLQGYVVEEDLGSSC